MGLLNIHIGLAFKFKEHFKASSGCQMRGNKPPLWIDWKKLGLLNSHIGLAFKFKEHFKASTGCQMRGNKKTHDYKATAKSLRKRIIISWQLYLVTFTVTQHKLAHKL